jgi:hypothetical protein
LVLRLGAIGGDRIERVALVNVIDPRYARRSEEALAQPSHGERLALGDRLHPADE